jgi:polyisoprenoid-binding protein YceI
MISMKKVFLSMFVLAGLALTSCSGEETATAENEEVVENVTYTIDSQATTLEWTGHYLIGEDVDHSHTGTVEVTEGTIVMNGEEFVEGSFTMNMTSINEPNPMSEEMGEKFVGHMNSADYFNTAEFPASTFTLKSFDKNGMAGTLNVLGMNMEVDFPATVTMSENGLTANGEFKLDLASLNLPGLQIDPENPENRVSPSVDFKLSLVMTK